jgi:hypothetical protein
MLLARIKLIAMRTVMGNEIRAVKVRIDNTRPTICWTVFLALECVTSSSEQSHYNAILIYMTNSRSSAVLFDSYFSSVAASRK